MSTTERLGTNICPRCSRPSVGNVMCEPCAVIIEEVYDTFREARDRFMIEQHGPRTTGLYKFNPLHRLFDPAFAREKNQELVNFARTWWREHGYVIEIDDANGGFKIKGRITPP